MSYTKGPWEIIEEDNTIIIRGEDEGDDYEGFVAEVRSVSSYDLRLIAAAPDLLEACEALIEAFGIEECDCGTDGSDCATCMALAAIKKAKGEG